MALQLVCRRTRISYEQLSVFCALLATLAVSCRQRTLACFVCITGLALLLFDGYMQNIVIVQEKGKRLHRMMEEPLDDENQAPPDESPSAAAEEEPVANDPDPDLNDQIVGENAAGHHSVAVDTPHRPNQTWKRMRTRLVYWLETTPQGFPMRGILDPGRTQMRQPVR